MPDQWIFSDDKENCPECADAIAHYKAITLDYLTDFDGEMPGIGGMIEVGKEVCTYQVDWQAKSIIHQGFGEDHGRFDIIDWLLDLKRRLKYINGIDVSIIRCSKISRKKIIEAFAKWSLYPNSKGSAPSDRHFIQECKKTNAIHLDGDKVSFQAIIENGVIYLAGESIIERDGEPYTKEHKNKLLVQYGSYEKIPYDLKKDF